MSEAHDRPRRSVIDAAWLASRQEDVIDPALPICDPHHHLWDNPGSRYLLPELLDDIGTRNVDSTIFVECGAFYRAGGRSELRPTGETEFASGVAAMAASGQLQATADSAESGTRPPGTRATTSVIAIRIHHKISFASRVSARVLPNEGVRTELRRLALRAAAWRRDRSCSCIPRRAGLSRNMTRPATSEHSVRQ